MPVKPVRRKGKDGVIRLIGYQWGNHGKIYQIQRYGKKESYNLARRQGIAIKISQLKN